MILQNNNCESLLIEGETILDIIANPGSYSNINIVITQNCDNFTIVEFDYTPATLPLSGNNVIITSIDINGETKLLDGIYQVKIVYTKGADIITEVNCLFVDCTIKCQVANKLDTIKDDKLNIHLAYYGLINGSNCGCECEKLCDLYNFLIEQLTEETIDCGTC